MFGMYLVPMSIYKFKRHIKFHLNSHYVSVNICIKIPSETLQFLPSRKLGNIIPSTSTDTNLLHKYEHFLLENWQFNHKIFFPLQLIPSLKACPHNLTKYESKQNWKIPIFQLFSELGKIWRCSLSQHSS